MSNDAVAKIFAGAALTPREAPPPLAPSVPATVQPSGLTQVLDSALSDFPQQPFKAYTSEQMEMLRESIIQHGILTPLLVRPWQGGYQIISGHNRRAAARQAGYTSFPCVVRELTDDDALIAVIETNLRQREGLLPSEKAWAYRMKLEAIKRQGERTDLTSGQSDQKWSRDEMAEGLNDSSKQIQRYIRLTYLDPILLEAVDNQRLGLGVGGTLSYLSTKTQVDVYNFFTEHKHKIDQRLADTLRATPEEDLTPDKLASFLFPEVKKLKRVSVTMKPIRRFFPADATPKEIEKQIIEILAAHFGKEVLQHEEDNRREAV